MLTVKLTAYAKISHAVKFITEKISHIVMKKSISFALMMLLIFSGISYGADASALKSKAEKGDTKAQVELGLMYHEGRDVKKDFNEAAK